MVSASSSAFFVSVICFTSAKISFLCSKSSPIFIKRKFKSYSYKLTVSIELEFLSVLLPSRCWNGATPHEIRFAQNNARPIHQSICHTTIRKKNEIALL